MGTTFTDYIRDAHRCVRLEGQFHIWEAANTSTHDAVAFSARLGWLGSDVIAPETRGAFVRALPFRAHANGNGWASVRTISDDFKRM